MMFGKANRPIRTAARLADLLYAHAEISNGPAGSLRVEVPFKGEKRSGEVFVRCAEVVGLGPVAHLTSPVVSEPTPELAERLAEKAGGWFVGDAVVADGALCVRATLVLAEAKYSDVVVLMNSLAITADELTNSLTT